MLFVANLSRGSRVSDSFVSLFHSEQTHLEFENNSVSCLIGNALLNCLVHVFEFEQFDLRLDFVHSTEIQHLHHVSPASNKASTDRLLLEDQRNVRQLEFVALFWNTHNNVLSISSQKTWSC